MKVTEIKAKISGLPKVWLVTIVLLLVGVVIVSLLGLGLAILSFRSNFESSSSKSRNDDKTSESRTSNYVVTNTPTTIPTSIITPVPTVVPTNKPVYVYPGAGIWEDQNMGIRIKNFPKSFRYASDSQERLGFLNMTDNMLLGLDRLIFESYGYDESKFSQTDITIMDIRNQKLDERLI